ncbi:hypothetical protein V8F20_009666, partial [Naviculisporaceae sp. PSN 640]
RPHRDWVPAPGRIKKCDFCEKRSQHVVHRCTRCPVLMCQDCAFNGTWKTDKHHSISPEKLNWEYAGTRKPRGSGPTTQPALPASGDSASRSDDTNKTDSSRTKRQVHFVSDDTVEDDTELSAPKRQRKTQSSIAHDSSPHDSTSAASETTDQLDEEGQGEYDEDSLPDHPAYMMTGGYYDQARSLPPPPPNYAEESFHNYPDKLGYTPTLRSTPIWHPMNEMSPEELRIMHNDHLLQNRMADAWQNNRIVMRVREFGLNAWNLTNWVPKGGPGEKDFEALQLLWEVAQVRINRLLLLVAPQTKKWFADELQRVF